MLFLQNGGQPNVQLRKLVVVIKVVVIKVDCDVKTISIFDGRRQQKVSVSEERMRNASNCRESINPQVLMPPIAEFDVVGEKIRFSLNPLTSLTTEVIGEEQGDTKTVFFLTQQ